MFCLCGCGREARTRGVFATEYQNYLIQVLRRQTTWSKLVADGKVLERQPRARNSPWRNRALVSVR
jgi:hypothetical protein